MEAVFEAWGEYEVGTLSVRVIDVSVIYGREQAEDQPQPAAIEFALAVRSAMKEHGVCVTSPTRAGVMTIHFIVDNPGAAPPSYHMRSPVLSD